MDIDIRIKPLKTIKYLAKHNVDICFDTLLYCCAEDGSLKLFKELVKCGASIKNNNVLYVAIKNGHYEIMKYILDFGVDQLIEHNCIAFSVMYGHLDILKYLLSLKDDNNVYIQEIVRLSAKHGHLHILKYLLQIGVDFLRRIRTLGLSAHYGHTEVVDFLIKRRILTKDFALTYAAGGGQLKLMRYLIKKGANIHYSALAEAALGGHLKIVKYLIKKKGSVICDEEGSALHYAVIKGDLTIVKYLVENCVIEGGFYMSDYTDISPLVEACTYGKLEIIKYLIEEIYTDEKYDDYFFITAEENHWESAKYFITLGVDIHYGEDRSLLKFIKHNNAEAVKYLLPLYNHDELRNLLIIEKNRKKTINFLLKNAYEYPLLVQLMREFGIDIYSLIEEETLID